MSLMPAKTCEEAAFNYCNYGYDKSKYSSRDECLKGENKKCEGKSAKNNTTPTEEEKRKKNNMYIFLGLGIALAAIWWYKNKKSA
jgi:hypothetical protein